MSTRAWQVYCMFLLPPVLLFCCGRAGALEGISGLPELLLSSFCFGSLTFFGWAFGLLLGRCRGRGGYGRAGILECISGVPKLLCNSFCSGSLNFFGWAFGFLLGRCTGRGADKGIWLLHETSRRPGKKKGGLKDIEGRRGRPRARQLMCPPARHTQHIYLYASALPTFQDSGGRCLTCCCGVRNLSARFKHISYG